MTDKSVIEAVYYWDKYSNNNIFKLILRLVYLELRGCFRLQIIWVSGSRQISSGIDGFSRVCLINGIALSGSILDLFPLNETPFDRSATILSWVWT